MLSGSPPTVTDLHVASSDWSPAFYDYLQQYSHGDLGFRIPAGSAEQSKSLPWFNIDKIVVSFSEDVHVDVSDLSVSGVNATFFPVEHFFYDAYAHVATWTLANPLTKNVYQIDLDGNGLHPVRDLNWNILDGEWTNNADAFPSGNGLAGGDFAFIFKVLPGDADRDNGVDNDDRNMALARQGLTVNSAGYMHFVDVDGSGVHESADAQAILNVLGATYPSGSPVGVANDAPSTTAGAALDIYASYGDVPISLFEAFQDAETPDNQLAFQIVSNSNPSLFDVAAINASSGDLVLNAGSASGRSVITVRATDSAGLSATATFRVDVNYVNADPVLNFYVEPRENNTFVIFGTVTDDDNVEGLIVTFNGAFNLRASVQPDGTIEFAVIVPPEEWGTVWGQVSDWQGLYSEFVEKWVGIS